MSYHKESHIRLASLCRSLGHPSRIALLEKLAVSGVCIQGDIVEVEHLSEVTVIKHLRGLMQHGILKGNLNRSKLSYCIDHEKLDEFKILFDELYSQVKQHQEEVTIHKGKCT